MANVIAPMTANVTATNAAATAPIPKKEDEAHAATNDFLRWVSKAELLYLPKAL